ncbi:hypothetical protein LEMLEM_LOCUS23151, partial [Lemmus lemmus]
HGCCNGTCFCWGVDLRGIQSGCKRNERNIHSALGMHLALLNDSWTWHEIAGGRAHLGGSTQLIGSWDLGLI